MFGDILVQKMRMLAARYLGLFGRSPKGYVIGIKDWRALKIELSNMIGGSGDQKSLDGIPIFLKVSSGIELLVDEEYAELLLKSLGSQGAKEIAKSGIVT